MGDYKLGQIVQTQDGRQGIIRFLGRGAFAPGEWAGLELSDDTGKNDGSVKGERYFDCPPGHGIMVRPESIVAILQQPAPLSKPTVSTRPVNGAATKPRPSSSINTDAARKRQSFLGPGSTASSRLSARSPVRSPTKGLLSPASSNASSPRTGTPATTARTSDSSTKSRLSTSARPSLAPPAPPKSVTRTSRTSVGTGLNKSAPTTRTQSRTSTVGAKSPIRSTLASRSGSREPHKIALSRSGRSKSPNIREENEDLFADANGQTGQGPDSGHEGPQGEFDKNTTPLSGQINPVRKVSTSQTPTSGNFETKAAQQREVEQLKAKIRTLDGKLAQQRDQVKAANILQTEKEKLETIIHALQNKLKSTLQAKSELQSKFEEAEACASQVDSRGGEHESELEMANLDKEMAEERAEILHVELESLKSRHEELELEVEILREENKELGAVMSPEEKASTGWIQGERERDRLREALAILRDMAQQESSDLKSQVKELQKDLAESEGLAKTHQETSERLVKSEAANKHLMEQLEAIESNEDLNLALEAEREQKQNLIDTLKEQLQSLQEEAQVSDELEAYHVATEKELQQELDAQNAQLNDRDYTATEQIKIIEDLEYTLSKFREVVSGLQGDIDDLRRSKDISESEAHEMSSKSRAMMDLNLQLQNSAAKMQMKTIDIELDRMRAEESAEHLAILQLFVPEIYESEKTPVLTFLCLRRIKSKALLVTTLLRDRIRDRPHLTDDDPFIVLEAVERLGWISFCCDRFLHYISACSPADLANFQNALHELEPVERAVNSWVEALKRDEISQDSPETLFRMRGILSDLIEKCIPEDAGTMASQLLMHTAMIEIYCDNATTEINTVTRMVESKLRGVADEEEELPHFDKKMDQFSSKTRTIKYVAGKSLQNLDDLRLGSMCPGEPAWLEFAEAEESARSFSKSLREVGAALLRAFSDDEKTDPWTYAKVLDVVQMSLESTTGFELNRDSDALSGVAGQLQTLQSKVDGLYSRSLDVSSATEFEKLPLPWLVRSREIKAQKVMSQDAQDQIRKLKSHTQEQAVALNEKDSQLEERQIKIELLESRMKETKNHSENVQKLRSEIEGLQSARERAEGERSQSAQELQTLLAVHAEQKAELEMLRKAPSASGNQALTGSSGPRNDTSVAQLKSQVHLLNTEVLSLQAAVRYLKMENYRAKMPPSGASAQAATHAWLDASTLSRPKISESKQRMKAESGDLLGGLLALAKTAKPLALKPFESEKASTSWRASKETPRYIALRQREELERWHEWRADLVKRARVVTHDTRKTRRPDGPPYRLASLGSGKELTGFMREGDIKVDIVGSPPG